MRVGDMGFFYHSNEGLCVVGVIEVIRAHYTDPTSDDARWVAVDIRPLQPLVVPVTLAQIKANPLLQEMALVRQGRLSVSPVTAAEWEEVLCIGQTVL